MVVMKPDMPLPFNPRGLAFRIAEVKAAKLAARAASSNPTLPRPAWMTDVLSALHSTPYIELDLDKK